MERLLTGVAIMHGIEAFVALGLCLYARVPFFTTIMWVLTVVVFGIPSLQNCLKVGIKYAMVRDPETFGVPKEVMDGTYMRDVQEAKEKAKSK
jgi:hypothetical protein